MNAPRCHAQDCTALAHHPSGMCAAHRRALILVTKVQDAVREFLHDNLTLTSSVEPTQENTFRVVEAGTCFAEAFSLLLSSSFNSVVHVDSAPIELVPVGRHNKRAWRVRFDWHGANSDSSGDELDDESEDQDCRL